jgi:hypothetical protein
MAGFIPLVRFVHDQRNLKVIHPETLHKFASWTGVMHLTWRQEEAQNPCEARGSQVKFGVETSS